MLLDALRRNLDNIVYNDVSFSDILVMIFAAVVVILFTLPIHEWAHGFVSTKLGDPTPRMQGRLTLNPLAHIDWIGAIGILLVGIGWAKPVQVNARYYKYPKWGMALVALAGPISNLIVSFLLLLLSSLVLNILIWVGVDIVYGDYAGLIDVISSFFISIAWVNVSLAVFNLIPLPPFDGSRILFAFLPQRYYFKIMQYEQFIFIGVFAVLCSGILDSTLRDITESVFNNVLQIASLPFTLLGV